MKSKYFEITGIKPPGRVDVFGVGEIKLHECSDEVLLKVYKTGNCPYVKLTRAGYEKYYPEKKTIDNTKKTSGQTKKTASQKKSTSNTKAHEGTRTNNDLQTPAKASGTTQKPQEGNQEESSN